MDDFRPELLPLGLQETIRLPLGPMPCALRQKTDSGRRATVSPEHLNRYATERADCRLHWFPVFLGMRGGGASASREPQKHDHRPVDAGHIAFAQAADKRTKPRFGYGRDLVCIRRQFSRRPFVSSGEMTSRKSGASVGSVVNAQSVTELVPSKRSSWRMSAGRGLPA